MCSTTSRNAAPRVTRFGVAADPAQRVGDPDRERTAAGLGQAFTQGYLSMEEYEARLGQAFTAQTAGELTGLTADLPIRQISRRDPQRQAARGAMARRGVQIHLIAYLAMSVLVIGIWLAVALAGGGWYFWPIWPILGAGIGVVSHAVPVMGARTPLRNLATATQPDPVGRRLSA